MQRLNDLLEKINAVNLNDVASPEAELETGDKVIGVMPDDLKKIYAVFCKSYDELAKRCEEAHKMIERAPKKGSPTDKDLAFAYNHALEHRWHEIISDIFWHSVGRAFPEIVFEEKIGVRKNWKVVVSQKRTPSIEIISMRM